MDKETLAKKLVNQYNMPEAEKYNVSYREFDDVIEVIGLVEDQVYSKTEYEAEGISPHKVWRTLGTVSARTSVPRGFLSK